MTTLILLVLTIVIIITDELNIRKKCRNNWSTSQRRIRQFNNHMAELKRLQHKDYSHK